MNWLRMTITAVLATLAASAIAAPGAQADAYSCTFTGSMGPVSAYDNPWEASQEDGVEPIVTDVQNNEGDGSLQFLYLNDTDDGDFSAEVGGQDGSYSFGTAVGGARCAYVETGGDPGRVSGVYPATITSNGEYNNIFCGTAWQAIDDDIGGAETTAVTFASPLAANITDADFRIDFTAGAGVLDIRDADNADGETGFGEPVDGSATAVPTVGNCITTEVSGFAVAGSFVACTGHRYRDPIGCLLEDQVSTGPGAR